MRKKLLYILPLSSTILITPLVAASCFKKPEQPKQNIETTQTKDENEQKSEELLKKFNDAKTDLFSYLKDNFLVEGAEQFNTLKEVQDAKKLLESFNKESPESSIESLNEKMQKINVAKQKILKIQPLLKDLTKIDNLVNELNNLENKIKLDADNSKIDKLTRNELKSIADNLSLTLKAINLEALLNNINSKDIASYLNKLNEIKQITSLRIQKTKFINLALQQKFQDQVIENIINKIAKNNLKEKYISLINQYQYFKEQIIKEINKWHANDNLTESLNEQINSISQKLALNESIWEFVETLTDAEINSNKIFQKPDGQDFIEKFINPYINKLVNNEKDSSYTNFEQVEHDKNEFNEIYHKKINSLIK